MRFIHRIAVCLPVLIGPLAAQYAEDAVRPFWGLGNPGSRASGLGETFTGIADDGTALFYNPGGLGNLDKAELNLGLNHLIVTTDIHVSSTGANYHSSINTTSLGNLVMAFPVPEAKITVAGGYHLAYAFERDWAYQNQAPGKSPPSSCDPQKLNAVVS